jgi:hypothetical protein
MTPPRKSIMVSADLHKRLRVLAAEQEMTIAEAIETALNSTPAVAWQWIKQRGAGPVRDGRV